MGQSHCGFDDPTTLVWQIEGWTLDTLARPPFPLSYCARQGYVTLTQKNLSDHLCWFTPGLRCPINPLDQLKRTFLMQEDLCCKWHHSSKIRVHEIWHRSSVFVLDFFKPYPVKNLAFHAWLPGHCDRHSTSFLSYQFRASVRNKNKTNSKKPDLHVLWTKTWLR